MSMIPMRARAFTGRRRPRSGLSIVELLIGIAIGLFVLAGASMVVSNQITDNKRLLLETQVQQDMRAAMDIIVRDMRRSGFSFQADKLQPLGSSSAVLNAYQSAGAYDASDPLLYTYSKEADASDNNAVDAPDVRGFRLQSEVVQVQLGANNWQALTDYNVVRITSLTATPTVNSLNLPMCQTPPCASTNACGNQRIVTRDIALTMIGEARHDSRVKRRIDATVRVRNDEVCL